MSPSSSTRNLFLVRVPVLSVQMTVAAPIVSQACSFLTRLFSLSIFLILNAILMVTLMGNPSGTATTMSVTAMRSESRVKTIMEMKSELFCALPSKKK